MRSSRRMVYIGAELTSPGVVEHSFSGALVFGERFHVPVLLNRTLYSLLARLDPASHPSSST
jgi:hypothetical protein